MASQQTIKIVWVAKQRRLWASSPMTWLRHVFRAKQSIHGDSIGFEFIESRVSRVNLKIFEDKRLLSRAAAEQAGAAIRRAIAERGSARIVAATGGSPVGVLVGL